MKKYETLHQNLIQTDGLQKYLVEVNEALKAGNQVMIYLDQTTQDLQWLWILAQRDMYSKGRWAGIFINLKHFKVPLNIVSWPIKALRLFQEELADIKFMSLGAPSFRCV